MKEYIWIGPEGSNPSFGMVTRGKVFKLEDDKAARFLSLKYIKLKQEKKNKKLEGEL